MSLRRAVRVYGVLQCCDKSRKDLAREGAETDGTGPWASRLENQ